MDSFQFIWCDYPFFLFPSIRRYRRHPFLLGSMLLVTADDDYRICYSQSGNALNRIVIVLPIIDSRCGDAVLQLDIKSSAATLPPPRYTHGSLRLHIYLFVLRCIAFIMYVFIETVHNPNVRIVFPATITIDQGIAGHRKITGGIGYDRLSLSLIQLRTVDGFVVSPVQQSYAMEN
jgi:hypothetical protein